MRGRNRLAILPILAGITLITGYSADQTEEPSDAESTIFASSLEVMQGTAMVLSLPVEVTRISVADEAVARVTILSTQEVLIHGIGIGRTTLFTWLADGELRRYLVQVSHDLTPLQLALADVDPRIRAELAPDGRTLVLTGEVDSIQTADVAILRAEGIVASLPEPRPILVNLLRFPAFGSPDDRLREALREIDPRIRLRRVQVSDQISAEVDSYVLEGRVEALLDLVRAVTLAERQLGGTGTQVQSEDQSRISDQRFRGLFGGGGLGGQQGSVGLSALEGGGPLTSGLAAQVAKKALVTSESGRVLSFLEVDRLEQILVSIRVLEIDRIKAKKRGIDYRVDGRNFSVTSLNRGDLINLDSLAGAAPIANTIGSANLVGAYVSGSTAILGAVDFLQEYNVARSVAEPNIMTLTGEQATIVVGGEVPIPTTTANQVVTVQGFFFQSFGVRLDIRPTVDREGIITLEVAPSIITPQPGIGVGDVPGFQVQSVETVARVRDGESLVIGGLLSYEEDVSERKVPIAGDIPLVSTLFKWRDRRRAEQELLFVISPHIMEDAIDGTPGPIELPSMRDINETGLRFQDEPQQLTEDGLPTSWVNKEREEWLDYVRRREELWRREYLHRDIPPVRGHRIIMDSTKPAPPAEPQPMPAGPVLIRQIPPMVAQPEPEEPRPDTVSEEIQTMPPDAPPLAPPAEPEPLLPAPTALSAPRPGGIESMVESLLLEESPDTAVAPPTLSRPEIEVPAPSLPEPTSAPSGEMEFGPAPAADAADSSPAPPRPGIELPAPSILTPAEGPIEVIGAEAPPTPPAPEAPRAPGAESPPSGEDSGLEFEHLLREIETIELPDSPPFAPSLPDGIPPIEPRKDLEEDIRMLDELIRENMNSIEEAPNEAKPSDASRMPGRSTPGPAPNGLSDFDVGPTRVTLIQSWDGTWFAAIDPFRGVRADPRVVVPIAEPSRLDQWMVQSVAWIPGPSPLMPALRASTPSSP